MSTDRERVILITGAASGVGAAATRALAGPGTALLLHTRRNEAGLEAVAEAARAAGADVETALADGPLSFGGLMVAVGSRDGRDVVRTLDELRQAGRLDRIEDGLYVLEGKAVYKLNQDWVEVEAGDYMWLRAFCPQACYAGGPGPFRYLLYKDVNRHAKLGSFVR